MTQLTTSIFETLPVRDWILCFLIHTALHINYPVPSCWRLTTDKHREACGPREEEEEVQTDSLRSNQVTEEGREEYEHQGIWNPGQVLQGDVPPQLLVNPLIGWWTGYERTRRGHERWCDEGKQYRKQDKNETDIQEKDTNTLSIFHFLWRLLHVGIGICDGFLASNLSSLNKR